MSTRRSFAAVIVVLSAGGACDSSSSLSGPLITPPDPIEAVPSGLWTEAALEVNAEGCVVFALAESRYYPVMPDDPSLDDVSVVRFGSGHAWTIGEVRDDVGGGPIEVPAYGLSHSDLEKHQDECGEPLSLAVVTVD